MRREMPETPQLICDIDHPLKTPTGEDVARCAEFGITKVPYTKPGAHTEQQDSEATVLVVKNSLEQG